MSLLRSVQRVSATDSSRRVTVDPLGSSVVVRARRQPFLVAFLGFWLVGWAFGAVSVVSELTAGKHHGGDAVFLVAWLGGWLVAGVFLVYVWAWNLAGREILSVESGILTVRRKVAFVDRAREFDADRVERLRVSPPVAGAFNTFSTFQQWGVGGGALAFDYGPRTYRFGSGLDDAEAREVLEALAPRLPGAART